MERIYAIGDIHGHLDKLRQAHERIARDRRHTMDQDAPVVHLGDLVDRGPDSAGVISYLLAGPAQGGRWVTLRGNHDHMFALFMLVPSGRDPALRTDLTWLDPRLGGATTLASYGIADAKTRADADLHREALAKVPPEHMHFLRGLPLYRQIGPVICVHAGLRPGIPLQRQNASDLMWIRAPFHDDRSDHGGLVVHGHTPVDRPSHHGNRLNLDTGAAYGRPLTAAVIEGRAVYELTDEGRVPVTPVDEA